MQSLASRIRSLLVLLILTMLLANPAMLSAQSAQRRTPGWLLFAGTSASRGDLGEDNVAGKSLSLRGGIRLPGVDLTLAGEYWRDWGGARVTSTLIEAHYFPFTAAAVSPFLVIGFGHSNFEPIVETLYRVTPSGSRYILQVQGSSGGAATLGVGVHTILPASIALRTEAVLRDDNGGFNGQLRLELGYASTPPTLVPGLPSSHLSVAAYGLAPLRGPWHFVEPGYVLRWTRPYSSRLSGTLALGIFHWRKPGRDTRAFLGMPGVELRLLGSDRLLARAGPAIITMGEGSDAGPNLGAHAELASVIRPVGIPIMVGVGSLWMSRGYEAGRAIGSDADELGLTFFGGLGF